MPHHGQVITSTPLIAPCHDRQVCNVGQANADQLPAADNFLGRPRDGSHRIERDASGRLNGWQAVNHDRYARKQRLAGRPSLQGHLAILRLILYGCPVEEIGIALSGLDTPIIDTLAGTALRAGVLRMTQARAGDSVSMDLRVYWPERCALFLSDHPARPG